MASENNELTVDENLHVESMLLRDDLVQHSQGSKDIALIEACQLLLRLEDEIQALNEYIIESKSQSAILN